MGPVGFVSPPRDGFTVFGGVCGFDLDNQRTGIPRSPHPRIPPPPPAHPPPSMQFQRTCQSNRSITTGSSPTRRISMSVLLDSWRHGASLCSNAHANRQYTGKSMDYKRNPPDICRNGKSLCRFGKTGPSGTPPVTRSSRTAGRTGGGRSPRRPSTPRGSPTPAPSPCASR